MHETTSKHIPQACLFEVACQRWVDWKVLDSILNDEASFSHMQRLQTEVDCAGEQELWKDWFLFKFFPLLTKLTLCGERQPRVHLVKEQDVDRASQIPLVERERRALLVQTPHAFGVIAVAGWFIGSPQRHPLIRCNRISFWSLKSPQLCQSVWLLSRLLSITLR